MNSYDIYLRKGTIVRVQAAGYSEAKREGRIYFHEDPEKKDRSAFFYLRDLAGVRLSHRGHATVATDLNELIESLPVERQEGPLVDSQAEGSTQKGPWGPEKRAMV